MSAGVATTPKSPAKIVEKVSPELQQEIEQFLYL